MSKIIAIIVVLVILAAIVWGLIFVAKPVQEDATLEDSVQAEESIFLDTSGSTSSALPESVETP